MKSYEPHQNTEKTNLLSKGPGGQEAIHLYRWSLMRRPVRSHGLDHFAPRMAPKKGVNRANKDFFPNFSLKFRILKLRFLAFSEGPGGFREVREAGRNHFHLSWYLLVPGITSYVRWRHIIRIFTTRNRDSHRLIFLNFLLRVKELVNSDYRFGFCMKN